MKFFGKDNEDYSKVLHIWNLAGVSCIFSKFLKKMGYKTDVIMRASHDPFGYISYYNETSLDVGGREFLEHAIKMSKHYGIIHIHSLYKLVPEIKKKYPKKKIVLHYHGLELTRNLDDEFRKKCDEQADLILCSTPNLAKLIDNIKYIENPVDTDLFRPLNVKRNGKALVFTIRYLSLELIQNHIKENNIPYPIEIIDREKKFIPNHKMPEFLNKYSYFLDIKYADGKLLKAHSKTALEALACGAIVIDYKNDILKELPPQHRGENSTKKLSEFYMKIINK